jgi:hypothetical protein
MLAMISEEASVKMILDNLMGGTGTRLAVAAAEEYIAPDQDASFLELSRECTLTRHQVLCGYILPAAPGERALPACVINPADKLARRRWRKHSLILITTDERLAATAPPQGFWDAPQGELALDGQAAYDEAGEYA